MYIKNPEFIETKSFEIIDDGMTVHTFTEAELQVVKRTIHTTGDFDYENIVKFKNNPIEVALEALKNGCRIVTDTKMVFSGINKQALEKSNSTLDNYIAHEEVYRLAKENGTTRSMAAVDFSLDSGVDIFVVGNAPTALFRIGELIKEGKTSPKLIIGVPVGFVGASESKEYIREFDIPSITTEGTKGGSNVAASIVNALLYMAVGR